MKTTRARPLEKSEAAVECPKCSAPAGAHCVYTWNGETNISGGGAHVERKRAGGRAWRVARILETLLEADLASDLTIIANAIDDALHPSGPGISGPRIERKVG